MSGEEARADAAAHRPLVAIDGPGGAGKSTVSRELSRRLELPRLDTGAMYRAVTLLALRREIEPDDAPAVAAIAESAELDLDGERVLADGDDVTAAIRAPEVDAAVSAVAANPAVRAALVARQQAWIAARQGAVVEGRDIGSVVAPQADLKVYLTATPEERATRRAAQHAPHGGATGAAAVGEAMERRDRLDASRADSPMGRPAGAVEVDSTGRNVGEVVEEILALLDRSRPTAPASPAPAPPPPAPAGGLVAGRPIKRSELRFYAACRLIAVGLSRIVYPGPVVGADRIPASGPYILAPVHRSNLDWLIVARLTRRRLRYIVKHGVWRVRSIGRLIELLGAFPVRRMAADREALNTAMSVLAGGEPLVLFPEGTRRDGPTVQDVRDGAAYLSLRAGAPIVPVGLAGTEAAMPRGAILPRPGRIALVVGEPIVPPPPAASATRATHVSRSGVRATTEALVTAMQSCFDRANELLGPTGRRRARRPAGEASSPASGEELRGGPAVAVRLPSAAADGAPPARAGDEAAGALAPGSAAGAESLEQGAH
ncbi:MAG TPA: (d)CMP kinase [Acidimicrobiales bacterium]|nr:(d)CMP kinase [Acidimicrobiales bacterium]